MYLKRSQTGVYNFGMVREQPAVGRSVATLTNKVPYVLQLEQSWLRLPTMHLLRLNTRVHSILFMRI